MDNVFLLSRHQVFSFRDGSHIYLFDRQGAENLMENGINPYNRKKLSKSVKGDLLNFLTKNQNWLQELKSKPMDEVIDEILHGRDFAATCYCKNEDPVYLLSKQLQNRGIEREILDRVHIDDLIFKMNMMGYSLSREGERKEIFQELLSLLKNSPPERKESIKHHICAVINVQRTPIDFQTMGF